MAETPRLPFNVVCAGCGAIWTAAYVPMPLATMAAVLRDCRCPWCGVTSDKHFHTGEAPSGPSMDRARAEERKLG